MSTLNRRYDSSARRADAESRRVAVVDAAARLFVEHGYGETTIARVAAEAGVSPQLVYAAFGGKAELLWSALDRVAAGDDQPILLRDRPESLALADLEDPVERMHAAAAQVAAINGRVGPLAKLLDRVSATDATVAELHAKMLSAMQEDYAVIAGRLAAGLRPDLGPVRVAEMCRVLCGVHIWHGLVVEGGWTQEQYTEWLGDALVRLLVLEP
jgi:AcrR family transcriptional regulator